MTIYETLLNKLNELPSTKIYDNMLVDNFGFRLVELAEDKIKVKLDRGCKYFDLRSPNAIVDIFEYVRQFLRVPDDATESPGHIDGDL